MAWKRVQSKGGQRFTDKDAAKHQRRVAGLAIVAWGALRPLFGPVKFHVTATFETPPSWPRALREAALRGEVYFDSDPDFDNIAKQIADALKFVAFVDDNQVGDARQILRYGAAARTDVWIQPLTDGTLPTPAERARAKRWRQGGYDKAIVKAPCGMARLPSVIDAQSRRDLFHG